MVSLPTALIAATTATAIGTGASLYQQSQAADAQEKARDASQAMAQVESARNRRKAIAQARVAQARNIAQESSAVDSSSSMTGAQSGLSSTLGSNIGMQRARIGTQDYIGRKQQNAADRMAIGSYWQAAGDIVSQGFQAYGMYKGGGGSGGE